MGGCLAACLAAVTRQNTVAVAVVAAILLWRQRPLRVRPLAWLAVLLPGVLAVAVHLWFQKRNDVRASELTLLAPPYLLQLPFVAIHICGLSALPLSLVNPRPGSWKTFAIAAGVMVICAGYWLLYRVYLPSYLTSMPSSSYLPSIPPSSHLPDENGLFPYTDNMLTPYGAFAGPRQSGGPFVFGERPLLLGIPSRVLLTLLGCAAGAALVTRGLGRRRDGAGWSPLLLFTLLQVPFLLIIQGIYDRYLLFLLPGALALALSSVKQSENDGSGRLPIVGLAVVVVFGGVSLALMHDWLAWNVARWQLGQRAVSRYHMDPRSIEGGVEWDGWYAGVGDEPMRREPRWPVLPFTREWFPAITGRYALSFSELHGTRRLDAEPYSMWLIPGQRQFY